MQVDISTAGELVVLKLGNFALSMHFADAMRVAHLLLTHGREARRTAVGRMGSLVPAVRALGLLSDATPEFRKPARWAGKPPEIYKGSEIFVRTTGQTVELKLRNTVAGLPYDAALAIAQHLRVRGKQARDTVNEKASWHELANDRVMH